MINIALNFTRPVSSILLLFLALSLRGETRSAISVVRLSMVVPQSITATVADGTASISWNLDADAPSLSVDVCENGACRVVAINDKPYCASEENCQELKARDEIRVAVERDATIEVIVL